MSRLVSVCDDCDHEMAWSDNYCAHCGYPAPPDGDEFATAAMRGAPAPTIGVGAVLKVGLFLCLGWVFTAFIGPLFAIVVCFFLILVGAISNRSKGGLTPTDLVAVGGYGVGLAIYVAMNARVLVTMGIV